MKLILYLLGLLLLLSSCDNDRFLGYNYGAQPLGKSLQISGNVTNTFTGRRVAGATVMLDNLQTTTDTLGNFQLEYILSADAEQGRPIHFIVQAEHYHPYDTSMTVFPGTLELNVLLDYGAPIIENQAIVVGEGVCQALIRDYQGQQNLTAVTVRLHYRDDQTGNIYKTVDLNMTYRSDHEPFVYRYQVAIPSDYPETQFGDLIKVTATDADGFIDEKSHNSSPRTPDQLLFPK
jgi:hypothetical protein